MKGEGKQQQQFAAAVIAHSFQGWELLCYNETLQSCLEVGYASYLCSPSARVMRLDLANVCPSMPSTSPTTGVWLLPPLSCSAKFSAYRT